MDNNLTIEKLMEAYDKIPKIDKSKIIEKMLIGSDTNKCVLKNMRKLRENYLSLGSIPIYVQEFLDSTKIYLVFADRSIKYFDVGELIDAIK